MGKRLKKELDERGMAPVQLCALVPDLDIGTLSAIYTRDSRGSKFAPDIAAALGLELRWLITGEGEKHVARRIDTMESTHSGRECNLSIDEQMILAAFPLLSDTVRKMWVSSAQDALAEHSDDRQRATGTKDRTCD